MYACFYVYVLHLDLYRFFFNHFYRHSLWCECLLQNVRSLSLPISVCFPLLFLLLYLKARCTIANSDSGCILPPWHMYEYICMCICIYQSLYAAAFAAAIANNNSIKACSRNNSYRKNILCKKSFARAAIGNTYITREIT